MYEGVLAIPGCVVQFWAKAAQVPSLKQARFPGSRVGTEHYLKSGLVRGAGLYMLACYFSKTVGCLITRRPAECMAFLRRVG